MIVAYKASQVELDFTEFDPFAELEIDRVSIWPNLIFIMISGSLFLLISNWNGIFIAKKKELADLIDAIVTDQFLGFCCQYCDKYNNRCTLHSTMSCPLQLTLYKSVTQVSFNTIQLKLEMRFVFLC